MSGDLESGKIKRHETLCHEIILEEQRLTMRRREELGYLHPLQSLSLGISMDNWMSKILWYAHAREISPAIERLYCHIEAVWAKNLAKLPSEYRFIDKDQPWKLVHAVDMFRLSEDLEAKISAIEKKRKAEMVDQLGKSLQSNANMLLVGLGPDKDKSEKSLSDNIQKEGIQSPGIYRSLIRYAVLQDYIDPMTAIRLAFYLAIGKNSQADKAAGTKRLPEILATAGISTVANEFHFLAHFGVTAVLLLLMDALKQRKHDISNLSYAAFKRDFDEFLEEQRARLGEEQFYERYPIREWLIPEEDKTDD